MKRSLRVALALLVLVAAGSALLYFRFRRDIRAARERLASGSRIAETPCGRIEFAEHGQGRAVLVSHGAGGGYDQGLAVTERLGSGFRIIAPSRFGYLRTPDPDDPSGVAQADAYACLLDSLGVARVVVIAFSAGGPSALQFALRHPARTEALIMVSAISDGSLVDPRPVDPSKDPALSTMLHDFPFWLTVTFFPDQVLRFFGMSREAQRRLTPEEHDRAVRVVRMILPMGMRATGNFNDPAHWFERGDFALESIRAPTLVIHARDDTFVAFSHGEYTARHIPNARLAAFDSGGHFVIVRDAAAAEVAKFLRQVEK
jgi:pimeloyl-ACP methyl ester carboxylesterase